MMRLKRGTVPEHLGRWTSSKTGLTEKTERESTVSTMGVKWSEVTQSCPTLCDPMGCSLPGSSIHGIFEARVLEGGAISFSKISMNVGQFGNLATEKVTNKENVWISRSFLFSEPASLACLLTQISGLSSLMEVTLWGLKPQVDLWFPAGLVHLTQVRASVHMKFWKTI